MDERPEDLAGGSGDGNVPAKPRETWDAGAGAGAGSPPTGEPSAEPSAPPPPPPPPPPVLPFEDPEISWSPGLRETVGLLLTRPRTAFERMPVNSDVLRPFLFAILLGSVGIAVDALYNGLFRSFAGSWMPTGGVWDRYQLPLVALPFLAVLGPFWTALGLVIGSAVLHLFLLLTGGARQGFAATFRVLCYVQVTALFLLVPACGGLVAGPWSIVLLILGFSAAHRIGIGRAALAVLLPTLLCCVCISVLAILFSTVLMQFLGGAQGLGGFQP